MRTELESNTEVEFQKNLFKFSKEEIKTLGVRTPIVRQISKKYFNEIKSKQIQKKEIFEVCEEFLKTGFIEESVIGFDWAYRCKEQFQESDFEIFELWLKNYVSNWGTCDNFCTHAFGELLLQFPDLLPKTKNWSSSTNRWLRRASAVVLIYPLKYSKDKKTQSMFLSSVFEVCDSLLLDEDDLVQKGYGWLLKETSNIYLDEVYSYVLIHKDKMSRTALRYAVEKFPMDLRKNAMEK
ncbi:MAG: DNA alkylation repair protein [Candidatus Diapherotrites archaeon]|nr:DNA alkylation repair protein [Candidatus Diapherotrites archaeon]